MPEFTRHCRGKRSRIRFSLRLSKILFDPDNEYDEHEETSKADEEDKDNGNNKNKNKNKDKFEVDKK